CTRCGPRDRPRRRWRRSPSTPAACPLPTASAPRRSAWRSSPRRWSSNGRCSPPASSASSAPVSPPPAATTSSRWSAAPRHGSRPARATVSWRGPPPASTVDARRRSSRRSPSCRHRSCGTTSHPSASTSAAPRGCWRRRRLIWWTAPPAASTPGPPSSSARCWAGASVCDRAGTTMTRTLGTLVWQAANDGANRIAVVDRDASLTYGELDALVCGYASALRNAGVAAGDVVAIHLDKSARAVAAIHAVLRLGAAYVPLDPKTPVPRLELIVGDARPAAVVVERRTAKVWRDTTIGAPPFVDSDGVVPSAVRIDPAVVDADALAYVLYTSGSTGTPKGVELTHANALAFVDWAVSAFAVGDGDRLASHAPFHFDLSIFDLYAAASTGASVALVPRAVTRFPVELSKWITDNHVTIWYSVPTALTLLVTHGNVHTADLSSLRVVLFAGEVFPVRHLAALMEA